VDDLQQETGHMSINITDTLPEQAWQRFVKTQPNSTVFHTPEMFRVFAGAKGYHPFLWAAVDDNSSVLALFVPVHITLSRMLCRLTTRAIVNGSVLYEPSAKGLQALDRLLEAYTHKAGRSVLFTELRNLQDMSGIQPILSKHGFVHEDHLNYLVNLALPAEQILQKVGKRTRARIRRTQRKDNVQVTEISTRTELTRWFQVLQKSYSHAQIPLADYSLFEGVWEELVPCRLARFAAAIVDGNIAACALELLYKDVIYAWYGGVDRAYSRENPKEFLTWKTLEWGAENGFHLYDFGGAGKPGAEYGVRDFKAKFGGDLVCYGRNRCVHAPRLLRLSEWGYGIVRRFL